MSSLLNSTSTVGFVLVFVVVAVVLSVFGLLVAEVAMPGLKTGTFNAGATAVKLAFGRLFGLILALTIAGLVANSFVANSAVADESTALAQLTRASQTLKLTDRTRMKAAIGQYVHAVAEDEFLTMKEGQASPLAAAALANLYSVASQSSASSRALSRVDTLTALRRKRLALSDHSVAGLLQFMLVIGAVIFLVLVYPPSIDKRTTRMLTVGGMAAFLALVLATGVVLEYPFAGPQSVSNHPYMENALATYWPAI